MVAGPEGKDSRFFICPNDESRLLLVSVRLIERSGLNGSCLVLETGAWLQILDGQKGLLFSSLLTCSLLKLWFRDSTGGKGEKREGDRFSRVQPGP